VEQITIKGTPRTPTINFNPKQGKLEIKGVSIPENSIQFYKPLLDSLEQYANSPLSPLQVDIQLEYFNTVSSKCVLDIFKRLKTIEKNGSPVKINWYYEEGDEDMREAGEGYQAIVNLSFNMQLAKLG
jgi:hypothetical protein